MKSYPSYNVIWKYQIRSGYKEKFELAYGKEGAWSSFFSKSENYRGSYLLISNEEVYTYMLIDTWINQQSYEDFIRMNKETYEEMSSGFEYLYETEEKLGSFNSVS